MFASHNAPGVAYACARACTRDSTAVFSNIGVAFGGDDESRGGERARARLLFGENYTSTAKRVPVSTGMRSASGANKSVQTKAVVPRRWVSGKAASTGDGDPNFYAREQILEPDAPARAARVKTRVRIQLKPATAHAVALHAKAAGPLFSYATAMFAVRELVRSVSARAHESISASDMRDDDDDESQTRD